MCAAKHTNYGDSIACTFGRLFVLRVIGVLIMALALRASSQTIYKCPNSNGRIALQDIPCVGGEQRQVRSASGSDQKLAADTGKASDAAKTDAPEGLDYGSARARREHAEGTVAELQLADKTVSLLNRRGVLAMDTGIRTLRDAAVKAADQLPLDRATRAMARSAVGRAIGDAFKNMPTML